MAKNDEREFRLRPRKPPTRSERAAFEPGTDDGSADRCNQAEQSRSDQCAGINKEHDAGGCFADVAGRCEMGRLGKRQTVPA